MMKKLLQKKLMWGIVVIGISQVLGSLAMLDFLSPTALKVVSFALGIALTAAKCIEMFWEQSAQLERTDETNIRTTSPDGTVSTQSTQSKTTVTPPTP